MWINLTPEEIKLIESTIANVDSDEARALSRKFAEWQESQQHNEQYIQTARARYQFASPWTDGDIEIDDDAIVSAGEEGAYVMGWFWVRHSDYFNHDERN